MSVTADFCTRLQSEGVGTIDVDLFENRLWETPENQVSVKTLPSMRPVRTMGKNQPPVVDNVMVQVIIRNTSMADGETKAKEVIDALDWFEGTLNGVLYKLISLDYGPVFLEQDENERYNWSCVFKVMKERA